MPEPKPVIKMIGCYDLPEMCDILCRSQTFAADH